MIFDLKSGKRRRVVQIVFGFLAFIFFISFVGFGIGSDVSGGIFDAIGLGGDSNDDPSSTYEQQIEEAEKQVDEDPKDEKALTDLARYRYLAGQEQLSFDEETGVATLTEEARSQWNDALDAWDALLKTDPKEIDVQVASQMICAYVPPLPICQLQAPADNIDLAGAAATQKLIAEQENSAGAWGQLASYYYFDGDIKAGDEATAKALELAKPNERKLFDKQLSQLKSDAEKFLKQQKQAQQAGGGEGEPQLENPLGGLGTDLGGGAVPQASP